MTIDLIVRTLGWCAALNYAVLMVWVLLVIVAGDGWLRLQQRVFGIAPDNARVINYQGIAFYKLGILLLNLVPYLALRLVLWRGGQ